MPAGDVLVRAGTVEEALEKASKALEAEPSEVEYEVVSDAGGESSSGAGKHEVLVRARRRGNASADQPSGGSVVPTAVAREVAPASVEITVSADGLTASAVVTPRRIVGPVPSEEAAAAGPDSRAGSGEEEVCERTVTVEDVEEALKAKGVVFGIDREAVEKAVLDADGLPHVVARGVPPEEGKDGFVEHLVELEPVPVVWEEGEDRVDYWERYRFPFVHAGDAVAVLHPPVPGTPGRAVTGEAIPPREVKEWALRAGEGAELSEDGTKVLATRDGKPVSYGSRYTRIEVAPVIVHDGNVGLASGHLRFNGDIVVRGDVLEGARVEGRGSVTVLGHAAGATIKAGDGIRVKGSVVNCHLRAGGMKGLASRLVPLLEATERALSQLEIVLQVMLQAAGSPDRDEAVASERQMRGGRGRLAPARSLVGQKLRELDRLAASIKELLSGAGVEVPQATMDAAGLIAKVAKSMSSLGLPEAPAQDDLRALRASIEALADWMEKAPSTSGGIVVGYAQNSVMESGGDILVAEKGCYNCNLSAAEGVRVKGNVRGGEIYAAQKVQVGSVGTPGQWPCSSVIKVAANGQIRAGVVYPGTTFQVGGDSFVFESTRFDVKAFLDDEGVLVIR
ncbi:MAG: flagellar assembly protein A [Betaproteobacteria bacterium]